ncbi:MAG: hypothetical protein NVS2B9_20360 [Myxococcales bacterium]
MAAFVAAEEDRVKKVISFAALLLAATTAIPSTARAEEFGLRIGLEAPIYTSTRYSGRTQSYNIGDTLQPAINAILTYKPDPVVGFDLEFREGFYHSGDSNKYSRTGTAIGPGLRFSAPLLPVYARVSLPIHVEPSPVVVGLRGAAGLEFGVAVVALYIEAAVDTSLVGGAIAGPTGTSTGPNVKPFDLTTVSMGTGLRFTF